MAGMRCVAANSMNRLRFMFVSASATRNMASGRRRVIVENATAKSSGSRTPSACTSTLRMRAAFSISR